MSSDVPVPSDFDRDVGQTFKVFGRFKVILSEKFEEATDEGVVTATSSCTIRARRWNSFESWNQGMSRYRAIERLICWMARVR